MQAADGIYSPTTPDGQDDLFSQVQTTNARQQKNVEVNNFRI
jgi:hypothetical protein